MITQFELDSLVLNASEGEELMRLEASLRVQTERPSWMLRSLLQLLERHPDYDFGVPGDIVRFLESYPRPEYEAELLASLDRQPTTQTTWMLNRLINDTGGTLRGAFLKTLRKLSQSARPDVRERAGHYLAFQSKRGP